MFPVIGKDLSDSTQVGNPTDADLRDVATTAVMLDLSERYVWQLIAAEKIRAIKHRGRRLVPTKAIREYLKSVPDRAVYSVAEAAIVLGLLESQVHALVESGEMASMTTGTDERFIPVEDVQRLEDARGAA